MIWGGNGINTGNYYSVCPATITGYSTSTVSIFVIGDSLAHAPNPNQSAGYHWSYVTQGLWGRYPFVMCAVGGEWIEGYLNTNNWNAMLLGMQSCDTVFVQLSVNNINNGDTFSSLTNKSSQLILTCQGRGKKVVWASPTPISSSTDNWATEANQTPLFQNVRTNFAAWLDTHPYGIGVVHIGQSVESTNKPGVWRVDGTNSTANSGGGGLHPSLYAITNYMGPTLQAAGNQLGL